jgi:hypothetical protein
LVDPISIKLPSSSPGSEIHPDACAYWSLPRGSDSGTFVGGRHGGIIVLNSVSSAPNITTQHKSDEWRGVSLTSAFTQCGVILGLMLKNQTLDWKAGELSQEALR